MELNPSALFAAVSIDILNSVELRDVFDNRNKSLEVIGFKQINDLLLEEFGQSYVAFLS
jgi:hypothetical protein